MENQTPDARAKPLTLTDMASCFIVLGIGTSFSFLAFLIEQIYKKTSDHCCFKKTRVMKVTVRPLAYENAEIDNIEPPTEIF